ncbi:ATP-grasp domain-containing protein [Spirosoma radiotolerans]|uniref:ATPase n=1 Tax=Spirosoma radiotolerans TaxID=1379870 RepID=A0A0E3ZZB9_9BACT|nr:ATPase [Spirosoma radiotolerans]AKD57568.1 ATPase [Spirosoma radiotolerans]
MSQLSFLCIATFLKGQDFMRACKELGNTVYLLTDQKLANESWPRESIDEMFFLNSPSNAPEDLEQMIVGLAHAMRSRRIDRVVALDDFDVEKGALIRETFRIDGMGQTTSRYFRDKLAMRTRAFAADIRVPAFCPLFHDETVTAFLQTTEAPWLIKPRSEASATGIRKVHSLDEAWSAIHLLGDNRHTYLIEEFKPGKVYHVDSLSVDGKAVFTRVSQYLATPMEVAHGGGVFRTGTLQVDTPEADALRQINDQVMSAFGMRYSASHSEYIRGDHDGELYFLETASRVGGAHIAEMIEAASGVNLWREWAKLETAMARKEHYLPPTDNGGHAGLIVSLARQQWPDLSVFSEPEIFWRMNREYHVGLIIQSDDRSRIRTLLDNYMHRIYDEFHASAPLPTKPTS